MTKEKFRDLLAEARRVRPKVFEAMIPDSPSLCAEMESLEHLLECALANSHREFLLMTSMSSWRVMLSVLLERRDCGFFRRN